jgi:hypothetical protein
LGGTGQLAKPDTGYQGSGTVIYPVNQGTGESFTVNQGTNAANYATDGSIIYPVEKEANNPAFGYNNTGYDSKSATDQILDKYGALRESTLAGLRAAYDKTRSGLQGQIPLVNQNARQNLDANDIAIALAEPVKSDSLETPKEGLVLVY